MTADGDGRLAGIFTAASAGAPMVAQQHAALAAGVGVLGDRYASGCGTFSAPHRHWQQVTLVSAEALAAVAAETGVALAPEQTRRNLLTEGVALHRLIGRELRIGEVVLRGLRLCQPCRHLEAQLGRPVRDLLDGRGGLNAAVVRGGTIVVGDVVTTAPAAVTTTPGAPR